MTMAAETRTAAGRAVPTGRSLRRTFALPLLILCLSLIGLVWALLATGVQDDLAALLVAVPILAIIWGRLRR